MATGVCGIEQLRRKINVNDSTEAFQTDAVKQEPRESDLFTEGRKYCRSGSETDFVDDKNATDSYQDQKEEKLNVKNENPEDFGNFKFSEDSSTSEYNVVQIKSDDDIDIFYKDVKSEAVEEQSRELFRFCEVCYESFVRESDSRFECRCQDPNGSLFYNVSDVKPSSLDLTTGNERPLVVRDETISGDEVVKEQHLLAEPLMISSVPPMKNFCKLNIAEKKFHCEICSKSFTNKSNLKVHERSHTGEKPFSCKICSKHFCYSSHLKIHERIHTGDKPFSCTICFKAFARSSYLKDHGKTHTGEKPFHCKTCPKTFTTSSKLKVHGRMHSGEKPFSCKICCKAFTTSSDLKVHGRIHTEEKPFHCKICSKPFSHASSLKVHERSHAGEKPFHCKICSKNFTTSGDLKVHGRIHTGEKPFHCKICLKSFAQISTLKCHERRHTGEKPLSCKIISKAFTDPSIHKWGNTVRRTT